MRAYFRLGTVILSLALLVPADAGAISQHYVLAASSSITLPGGSAQPLTGSMELSFKGLCVVPFDPGNCLLRYDFDAIDLSGGGESIVLGSVTPFHGAIGLPGLFADFDLDFPGSAIIDDFSLDRHTVAAQFPESARFSERLLNSPDPNTALEAIFHGDPLPSEIFFDVELIDKILSQILLGTGWSSPKTVSTDVVARLSIHAVAVPEPGTALLLTLGLAALGTRRLRR